MSDVPRRALSDAADTSLGDGNGVREGVRLGLGEHLVETRRAWRVHTRRLARGEEVRERLGGERRNVNDGSLHNGAIVREEITGKRRRDNVVGVDRNANSVPFSSRAFTVVVRAGSVHFDAVRSVHVECGERRSVKVALELADYGITCLLTKVIAASAVVEESLQRARRGLDRLQLAHRLIREDVGGAAGDVALQGPVGVARADRAVLAAGGADAVPADHLVEGNQGAHALRLRHARASGLRGDHDGDKGDD
mmetsp:Transcript_16242/g.41805  ORF Transcript_16242/g.41805 Transcript_16242/m.41805 type:complete len:252 (+) Transcript_16242:211-966(+)|eukprot:CAMPEP_0174886220 /NCGR_PEP_ID=MMETSP0167-20121228/1486_1 /TAXON_ID=38298 /ORGANISM="Rhodella maculata, Strain CCMP736" /LENGTH=251 /DNA_ID=CAMNT_0016122131 /DNA_START=176 /DNA_END=931 /DNA_ORIENTATION=-